MSLSAGDIRGIVAMAREAERLKSSVAPYVVMAGPALEASAAVSRSSWIAEATATLVKTPSALASLAARDAALSMTAGMTVSLDAAASLAGSTAVAEAAARLTSTPSVVASSAARDAALSMTSGMTSALVAAVAVKQSSWITEATANLAKAPSVLAARDAALSITSGMTSALATAAALKMSLDPAPAFSELVRRLEFAADAQRKETSRLGVSDDSTGVAPHQSEVVQVWRRDPYIAALVILILVLYVPSWVLVKTAEAAAIYGLLLAVTDRRST